jgi:hypothetical protein
MPFFIHVTAKCAICEATLVCLVKATSVSDDEVLQIDRWDATPDSWSFEREYGLRCSECVANKRYY